MGKYKHEGKGRDISVGGGQERKDLFKDMSGGYNAMGDSNSPNYKYNGSAFKQRYSSPMEKYGPLHGNAFGHAMQKAGGDYEKAKSMLEMKGSPMYKRKHQVHGVDSKASEPKGSMKGLNKKTAPKIPEPKQTARIETRMKTVYPDTPRQNFRKMPEKLRDPLVPVNLDKPKLKTPLYKSGCTSGGSSRSPYKLMGDPNKKMDRLSARHKKLYDRFEMGQTSEAEEQRMYKLEDKMEKVGKKIKSTKKTPLNQGTESKYKKVNVQDLEDMGAVKKDKKGMFVVNSDEMKTGTSRDTLRLPRGAKHYSGKSYKKGQLIDESDFEDFAKSVNNAPLKQGGSPKQLNARMVTPKIKQMESAPGPVKPKKRGASMTKTVKKLPKTKASMTKTVKKLPKTKASKKEISSEFSSAAGSKVPLNQGVRPSDGSLQKSYGKRHDRLRKKGKELDKKSFNQPEKKVRKSDRQYLRSRKKLNKAREIRKNNK